MSIPHAQNVSGAQMPRVIRTVHSHGAAIDSGLTGTLVQRVTELHRQVNKRAQLGISFDEELAERKWEVLTCLANGCTNAEIGGRLYIVGH